MIKGLFVGLCTIDIQLFVDDYPESNTKNKVLSSRMDTGGPATNAAIVFALLGGKARLLTMIGQHEFRNFILEKLNERKIEVIDLIEKLKAPPVISTIISSMKSGERTILTSHLPTEKAETIKKIPEDFNICLCDGFLAGVTKKAASISRQSGKVVVLDGGSWKPRMRDYLKYIDYAVCSSDFHPPGCNNMEDVISFLLNKQVRNIAITRGEKSIIAVVDGEKTDIQVSSVNAVDTLGAGDVFHGALCYYLPGEYNFVSALRKASYVASESCKYCGIQEWSVRSDILTENKKPK